MLDNLYRRISIWKEHAMTDQRGKAQAWDEGWREGLNVGRDNFDALSLDENPYRADQEGNHE